jgi:hypothetical protein
MRVDAERMRDYLLHIQMNGEETVRLVFEPKKDPEQEEKASLAKELYPMGVVDEKEFEGALGGKVKLRKPPPEMLPKAPAAKKPRKK